jgi:hypothetical protein
VGCLVIFVFGRRHLVCNGLLVIALTEHFREQAGAGNEVVG